MANKHRAQLMTKESWIKPWKFQAQRLTGKYVKCSVCSGKEWKRMTHDSRMKKMRRENDFTLICED